MKDLEKIPNKSEFIRSAVAAALQESCPFCGGTGTLTPHQRRHWAVFLREHTVHHCRKCNGVVIDCLHGDGAGGQETPEKKRKRGKEK